MTKAMMKEGHCRPEIIIMVSNLLVIGRPRIEKKMSVRIETNRNKICFGCVSVCFVKPRTTIFCLFRCFEPISKQPKQTELFRIKLKQTEATLNFQKNTKICSLSNCFGWSSVCWIGTSIVGLQWCCLCKQEHVQRMHLSNLVRCLFKCYHFGPTFSAVLKFGHACTWYCWPNSDSLRPPLYTPPSSSSSWEILKGSF